MGQRHWEAGEKEEQHNKDERMNGGQRGKMTKGRKGETGMCLQNVEGEKKIICKALVGLKASKGVSSMSRKMQKKGREKAQE